MSDLTFEIDGLRRDRKIGTLWVIVGTVIAVLDPLPRFFIPGVIVLGAITGFVRVVLFSHGKIKWGNAVILIEAVLLVSFLLLRPGTHSPSSPWQYLAVGALAAGLTRLITGLNEKRINARFNAYMFGRPIEYPEPATVEPTMAWQELPAMAPSPVWERLKASKVPALLLESVDAQSPAGIISKFGGRPDLPTDFVWPAYNDRELDFLAQIRLDDVARVEDFPALPKSGLLSVFYASDQSWGFREDDLHGARVMLHPIETVRPSDGGKDEPVMPVKFTKIDSLNYDEKTRSTIWALEETIPQEHRGSFSQLIQAIMPEEDRHQMLGYPVLIQGDMDDELALASRLFGLAEDTSWTLLLQLCSEHRVNWCWGDAGFLYFWIPSADLAEARFDRVWAVLQCM